MKVSAIGLILGSLAAVGSAKKYFNREILKDKTGLLGIGVSHIYESPDDTNEENPKGQNNRALRGPNFERRTSGEPEVPPLEVDDDELAVDFEPQTHYQAENLDFFKKGIDPDYFEWVNPDEIQAGATTCGFLKPELGSLDDVIYPSIEVYVCMRFALTQPAAKGNIFVHCGGPLTTSDCIELVPDTLGEQNLNDYNFLSIDQRGLGRSWPSFVHDECSQYDVVRAENGTLLYLADPPEMWNSTFNNNDPDDIILRLQPIKRRNQECWTCVECDFFLNSTQPDGNVTQFHFLEYSGTRQLAEDIYRMRLLINAPSMHFHGISYGTTVFSTYATVFPTATGLMVLDSNAPPNPDAYYRARSFAIGTNDRIDYIVYSCSARNNFEPGSCPVEDMRACITDLSLGLDEIYQEALGGPGFVTQFALQTLLKIMYNHFDLANEICDLAAEADYVGVRELALELAESSGVDPTLFGGAPTAEAKIGHDASSKPTPSDGQPVYGNGDYTNLDYANIAIVMVNAQDQSGPVYDELRFAQETIEINQKYTGAGTGVPGQNFFTVYSTNFYWPKVNPLPPAGNSFLTGIVLGVLYDPNTPYVWTQEMRNGFKSSSLLTSQSTFHGVANKDPSCQRHVVNYFQDGFVNFVDGQTCGADFASEFDLGQVFGFF